MVEPCRLHPAFHCCANLPITSRSPHTLPIALSEILVSRRVSCRSIVELNTMPVYLDRLHEPSRPQHEECLFQQGRPSILKDAFSKTSNIDDIVELAFAEYGDVGDEPNASRQRTQLVVEISPVLSEARPHLANNAPVPDITVLPRQSKVVAKVDVNGVDLCEHAQQTIDKYHGAGSFGRKRLTVQCS